MRGKLLSTLALRLESHTATPSLMFAQRDGNLRRREGGGTAGASRSKWRISAKLMPYCSYQLTGLHTNQTLLLFGPSDLRLSAIYEYTICFLISLWVVNHVEKSYQFGLLVSLLWVMSENRHLSSPSSLI